ncbi:hypothetical protein FGO68_gene14177 [Halteria grandinella]|uniref:Uncharacterized protein n=1 Tax=Halteria grandinella TaxID=5974 RepID=A0A8J8P8Z3_HALGN|nr:hypothetical protein FGO68_gene14177 [Halteria grandinella]
MVPASANSQCLKVKQQSVSSNQRVERRFRGQPRRICSDCPRFKCVMGLSQFSKSWGAWKRPYCLAYLRGYQLSVIGQRCEAQWSDSYAGAFRMGWLNGKQNRKEGKLRIYQEIID